jgi:hypothetical protein
LVKGGEIVASTTLITKTSDSSSMTAVLGVAVEDERVEVAISDR